MKLESLEQLYVEQLQDLYSAEDQIIAALPRMVSKSSSPSLRQIFEKHLKQTRGQIDRLEEIFDEMGEAPKGPESKGMKGLLAGSEDSIQANTEPEVRDAALAAAAQRVEHYEIAGYGTARTYAELLGQHRHSELLQQTIEEEKQANQLLQALASNINLEAKAA